MSRKEQLREAQRAHRLRRRKAGIVDVQLQLPSDDARRLRVASRAAGFKSAFATFLDGAVLDLQQWPLLRDLAWNRAGRWIAAEDAFGIYERNKRFVDRNLLSMDEARLIHRLKRRFGRGLNSSNP